MAVRDIVQAAAGVGGEAEDIADAVDFNGTNNFLEKSSDLTGNANGKFFTFSCWVYITAVAEEYLYTSLASSSSTRFEVSLQVATAQSCAVRVRGKRTDGILVFEVQGGTVSLYTWTNIIVSGDQENDVAYIVVNDFAQSVSDTYTNSDPLAFANSLHEVGRFTTNYLLGRLAYVYLDYTYRDMSIEANRRLFITSDRKPVTNLESLNPILFLPLNDPTSVGTNLGTGGNFSSTGVFARSGRGPSQTNASTSLFDRTNDYVSRSATTMGSPSKQLTIAFTARNWFGTKWLIGGGVSASPQSMFLYGGLESFNLVVRDASNNTVLSIDSISPNPSDSYLTNEWVTVVISVDLTDTNKRHVCINGRTDWVSASFSTYTNANMDLTKGTTLKIGTRYDNTNSYGDYISQFYLHTGYIDLSVQANIEKFMTGIGIDCKPAFLGGNGELPLGETPLIYLPFESANAGKNYGSAGDFSVTSGPYPSTWGPNEFFGQKAVFGPTTSGPYLYTNSGVGITDGKTGSLSFWIRPDVATTRYVFTINPVAGGTTYFGLEYSSAQRIQLFGGGLDVRTADNSIPSGSGYKHILISWDLTDSGKRSVYIDGVAASGVTWSSYNNTNIQYSGGNVVIAARNSNYADTFDGRLSEFYFTTEYIDFTQQATRLKFIDAFKRPVALLPSIAAEEIPNPAIYFRFNPRNYGENSGTGGNFTKVGTITYDGPL